MVRWPGRDFDSSFPISPHSVYGDNFTCYLLADIRLIPLDIINSNYFTKCVFGNMPVLHFFTYVILKLSLTYKAATVQNVS